jgi:twitching motility protein PilI
MAKRQSLKELQERLAQRLTAARSEGVTASWLAVEVGSQRCLLPLVQSGEIFPWTPVQGVPYTRPWYVGVANLRGGLFGVVDLAALLNASTGSGSAVADRVTSESRLVSLHAALGVNAVLWVDRLLGLRGGAAFVRVDDAPAQAPRWLTRVLVDAKGDAWQELDLQVLVNDPAFLAIAA